MKAAADALIEARTLHRDGKFSEARRAYEALIAETPGDADLLGLLGVLNLQQGDLGAAERMLRASLADASGSCRDSRILLRNLNNLVALLRDSGRGAEAAALLAGAIPDWPAGTPASAAERAAVLSLIEALLGYDQPERARRLLDRAFPERGGDAELLNLDGRLRLEEGDMAGAAGILARASRLAPDFWQPLIALSAAQDRLGDRASAAATLRRVAQIMPVFALPSRPSQMARVLVMNAVPRTVGSARSGLRSLHFSANFPAQMSETHEDAFQFISLFGDLPLEHYETSLPEADVILNNIADAETMNIPGKLEIANAMVERLGLPVINHPTSVFTATRQKNALRLAGVPDLVIPQVERYRADVAPIDRIVKDIGERFAYPVILRLPIAHMSAKSHHAGKDTAVRLDDAASVRGHLEESDWREFYAVQFVDLRRPDGFYRKIRVAVVDQEIIVTQPVIDQQWMASNMRWKEAGAAFYRANPKAQHECEAIARDPARELGAPAMRVLEAIRDRLPLDIYGIDCDVDAEGRVVLFEANAAMNLFIRGYEPPDIRLPSEPYERLDAAVRGLIMRRKEARALNRA